MTVRVPSRKVEEVDTSEGDEEAAEKRKCVDGIGGVEAAEKDEGSAKSGRRKRHVVKRVDTVKRGL